MSTISCNSAGVNTAPVGLHGEFTSIIRVFSVTAALMASRSGWKLSLRTGTFTGTAPMSSSIGSYEAHEGARRIASSPGIVVIMNEYSSACLAPGVITTSSASTSME